MAISAKIPERKINCCFYTCTVDVLMLYSTAVAICKHFCSAVIEGVWGQCHLFLGNNGTSSVIGSIFGEHGQGNKIIKINGFFFFWRTKQTIFGEQFSVNIDPT